MQIQTIKDVTFIGRTLRFVLFCLRVVNMSILDVVRRKRALTFLRVRPSPGSVLRFAVVDKTQHRNFV